MKQVQPMAFEFFDRLTQFSSALNELPTIGEATGKDLRLLR